MTDDDRPLFEGYTPTGRLADYLAEAPAPGGMTAGQFGAGMQRLAAAYPSFVDVARATDCLSTSMLALPPTADVARARHRGLHFKRRRKAGDLVVRLGEMIVPIRPDKEH